ncbi:DUF4160 domain-containing protein [Persicitalea sp.]|uniref:DUF4160 domain-containing protein n=1 Tax=Persicitalea sp. TaxID=3100273 RepID=UPI0035936245
MGKLLIFAKYYFFIWAGEDPNERLHVHIYRTNSKNAKGAKFWLDDLSLFDRGDFSDRELSQIEKDLKKHLTLVKSQVKKLLSGEKVKAIKIR